MERTRALDHDEVERFVASLADYHPVIPDELVRYYLVGNDGRMEALFLLSSYFWGDNGWVEN